LRLSFQGLTYRLFSCALCAALVLICSKCDYGHRYCCEEHSKEGRRQKHAKAQADYQREHHDTWKVVHKDQQQKYRDRKRAGAPNDPQTTASDSSNSASKPAPKKVVVTGCLIPQQIPMDAAECSSPDTCADQGTEFLDDFTPESKRTEEREQAASRVTDQTLASPATQIKVSVQAHPATDDTSERPIEARYRHKPMCCMFCERVLASFAGVSTCIWSG
jgi:hypothetical protein